jgi:hypothetical protein
MRWACYGGRGCPGPGTDRWSLRTMKALSYRHGLRETAQIGASVIYRQ